MKDSSTQILSAKLQDAMCRLEAYSKKACEKQSASPLRKTISLFKSLIFDKKREQIEILQAIDIISRERLFIQKLKEGTQAERNLADALTKTIETYNNSHDCYQENQHNQLPSFFLKFEHPPSCHLPKIDLPQEKSLKFHYPGISCQINSNLEKSIRLKHKAAPFIKSSSTIQLSKQIAELFQMKALALLERYGIATNFEARNLVKNSPIITTIESETSTCTLTQQLLLFPGQTIVVMGSSELNLKTQTIHRLFPETFYISLESAQTGFPHPSQRSGWALANQLLPESPQRPDLLCILSQFFERKKSVTMALLPHSRLLDKAKHLLKLKKCLFETHKNELIELHREFALTLLQTAPSSQKRSDSLTSIIQFYDSLYHLSNPFDLLSDAHLKMRDLFICRPHKALLEAITETSQPFQQKHQGMSYEIAKNILQNAFNLEAVSTPSYCSITWNYIACLGCLLGTSTNQIILQYLSEDLLYAPPILNSFEQKIQSAAYKQAEDFINELHMELSPDKQTNLQWMYQKLKTNILNDIAILNAEEHPPISVELAHYFLSRHQSL